MDGEDNLGNVPAAPHGGNSTVWASMHSSSAYYWPLTESEMSSMRFSVPEDSGAYNLPVSFDPRYAVNAGDPIHNREVHLDEHTRGYLVRLVENADPLAGDGDDDDGPTPPRDEDEIRAALDAMNNGAPQWGIRPPPDVPHTGHEHIMYGVAYRTVHITADNINDLPPTDRPPINIGTAQRPVYSVEIHLRVAALFASIMYFLHTYPRARMGRLMWAAGLVLLFSGRSDALLMRDVATPPDYGNCVPAVAVLQSFTVDESGSDCLKAGTPMGYASTADWWSLASWAYTVKERHCNLVVPEFNTVQELAFRMVLAKHPSWSACVDKVRSGIWCTVSKAWHGLGIKDWVAWVDVLSDFVIAHGARELVCSETVYPPGVRPIGSHWNVGSYTTPFTVPGLGTVIDALYKEWDSGFYGLGASHIDSYTVGDVVDASTFVTYGGQTPTVHDWEPIQLTGVPLTAEISITTIGRNVVELRSGSPAPVQAIPVAATNGECEGHSFQYVPSWSTNNVFNIELGLVRQLTSPPVSDVQITEETDFDICSLEDGRIEKLVFAGVPFYKFPSDGLTVGNARLQRSSGGSRRRRNTQDTVIYGNLLALGDQAIAASTVVSGLLDSGLERVVADSMSSTRAFERANLRLSARISTLEAYRDLDKMLLHLELLAAVTTARTNAVVATMAPNTVDVKILSCEMDSNGAVYGTGSVQYASEPYRAVSWMWNADEPSIVTSIPTTPVTCSIGAFVRGGYTYRPTLITGTYYYLFQRANTTAGIVQDYNGVAQSFANSSNITSSQLRTAVNGITANALATESRVDELETDAAAIALAQAGLANSVVHDSNFVRSALKSLTWGIPFSEELGHVFTTLTHSAVVSSLALSIYNFLKHRRDNAVAPSGGPPPFKF